MTRRAALILVLAIPAALVAVGTFAYQSVPDPIKDARAFLAPYRELSAQRLVISRSGGGDESFDWGRFERDAPFTAEAARMRAAFPASRGWYVSPTVRKGVPMTTAMSREPSRLGSLLRRLPFVPKRFLPSPGLVSVLLLPNLGGGAKPTGAKITIVGRPYPFRTPPTELRRP